MIMSADRGGIFDVLLGLVRRRLGGSAAGGRQYVSWIHGEDFARAVRFLIRAELSGPVNVAAPNPLPYAEFMRALREAWGARVGLPATRWMLELGAWAMRTETELVLKSRRVGARPAGRGGLRVPLSGVARRRARARGRLARPALTGDDRQRAERGERRAATAPTAGPTRS